MACSWQQELQTEKYTLFLISRVSGTKLNFKLTTAASMGSLGDHPQSHVCCWRKILTTWINRSKIRPIIWLPSDLSQDLWTEKQKYGRRTQPLESSSKWLSFSLKKIILTTIGWEMSRGAATSAPWRTLSPLWEKIKNLRCGLTKIAARMCLGGNSSGRKHSQSLYGNAVGAPLDLC